MAPHPRAQIVDRLRKTAADRQWSSWRLTSEIQQQADTPTLLMAWRLAMGVTQEQVCQGLQGLASDDGQSCAVSCQQLSRWEHGKERPGPFYRRLLTRWYRTNVDRLGLGDDPVSTYPAYAESEEDPLKRRTFLGLAAAAPMITLEDVRKGLDSHLGVTISTADVDHWHDVVIGHASTYGHTSPAELLTGLTPDMAALAELCRTHPHQRDLHVTAARLAGLIGAAHTDLGHDRDAREWLHTAARLADLSGDNETSAWIVMAQAMTALYSPQLAHVIAIADRAAPAIREAGPGAAQLAGLVARAHAQLGRHTEARQALRQAQTLADKLTPAQQHETFFGFPRRELAMYTSQVLTVTDSADAWDAQQIALNGYPDDDPMDRPLILLDRARFLIARDEIDAAADTAAGAITSLTAHQRVPLLLTQAAAIGDLLAQADARVAANYIERIAA
ncbi:hypothetical protein [Streptosporangium amethystogenes]|uniref:hypothetical protein n=1 Tax=Streptosporangium amethystogenes TaxID=2002 RepID=UPI0012FA7E14|nr:hypothetical protein [Streptosporangium amethystogenes]